MEASLNRFKDKFIEEAGGLLDRLEKDLLELENKPANKELIESAFRAMHTIKGASSMFGFDFICEFTHHMESMYQLIREEKLQFNSEISDITFQSIDHIRKLLHDDKFLDPSNQKKHNALIDSITKVLQIKPIQFSGIFTDEKAKNELARTKQTWHILMRTSEAIFFRGISLTSIFHDLAELGEYEITRITNMSNDDSDTWSIFLHTDVSEQDIREVLLFIEDDCSIVNLTQKTVFDTKLNHIPEADMDTPNGDISILDYIEDTEKQKKSKVSPECIPAENLAVQATQAAKRISVDASKLDQLMFLVSELITVNSQVNLSARDSIYNPLRPYLEKIDSLAKQFRNNALEIRLVPLSDTVLRFQRLIRDLSKLLNKKVNFVTNGTNTELDKNTIDQLTEPLMHIIRNCIDHGIESPEVRAEKGKPENGSITLAAYNSGNNVYITISDDGCGIDEEKVKQKAIEKGYLKTTDNLCKKDIYDLIFMPGFSTAQNLTEVSGRGVGMDVVKRRITDLRGEVMIDSEPGAGTTFTLKLQQSMSIIDSLLFTVDNSYFTVPLSEIEICEQVENSEVIKQRHTSTLPFNNHLIPFVDLRHLFFIGGEYRDNLRTIVIRNADKEMALLCDKIIGEHQAVLKPLGKSLRNQEYITAASQMGDGKMAFMIDTNALFKLTAM